MSTDELRSRLHGMWAGVADAWNEHADYIDARGQAIAETMLDLVAPAGDERVLELACGPGGLGLAAAERVGPDGEVVLSDIAAEMTAAAERRAAARGLDNISALILDLERIEQPDDSYDVVLCREALMLVPDPGQAASEIGRVLRPGGRMAVAVWGPRERNPWLAILLDAVSAQLGAPIPPPGIPGPFSLDSTERLAAVLSDAGLADVDVREQDVPMRVASFEEWWERTRALAGPLAQILAALPQEAVAGIRDRAEAQLDAFRTAQGLELPGVSLIARARA